MNQSFADQRNDGKHEPLVAELEDHFKGRQADQQGELATSTRVTRQANNPQSFPTTEAADGVTLSPHNLTLGQSGEGALGSLVLDRVSALAKGSVNVNGQEIAGTGGIIARMSYGDVSLHTGQNNTLTAAAINGAGVHGLGLTATQKWTDSSITEGAFVVGDASSTAKVMDHRHSDNFVQVAFKDSKFLGLQVTLGGSHGVYGAGVRGYAAIGRDYQLKRWMSPQEAHEALQKQSYLRQKLRALRLLPEPFERPNLADPISSMRVGDEVSFVRQNTLTGGIAAALGGVYVGLHGSVNKEHRLLVERSDETTMRVTITPVKSKSTTTGIAVDVPLVASATASISRSKGQLFSFEFDMSKPMGLAAYRGILANRLPNHHLEVGPNLLDDPQKAIETLKSSNMFASGVRLVDLVYGERNKDLQVSAGLTALPNLLGDKVGMMGARGRFGQSQMIAASPTRLFDRTEAAQERRWGFVRPGDHLSSAKLVEENYQVLRHNGLKTEQSLFIEATLSHERLNDKTPQTMRKWTHDLVGESIPTDAGNVSLQSHASYGVKLTRQLTDQDLLTLSLSGKVKNLSPLAHAMHDNNEAITDVDQLTDDHRKAIVSALKDHFVKDGIPAFKNVNEILTAGDATAVRSVEVEVLFDPLKNIEDKQLEHVVKFAEPITPKTSAKELRKRITAAQKHLARLDLAEKDIKNDGLVKRFAPTDKEETLKKIREKKQELFAYLDLSKLNNQSLRKLFADLPQDKQKFLRSLAIRRSQAKVAE